MESQKSKSVKLWSYTYVYTSIRKCKYIYITHKHAYSYTHTYLHMKPQHMQKRISTEYLYLNIAERSADCTMLMCPQWGKYWVPSWQSRRCVASKLCDFIFRSECQQLQRFMRFLIAFLVECSTYTHTHTYVYAYVYIYEEPATAYVYANIAIAGFRMYLYVAVCVSVLMCVRWRIYCHYALPPA